MRLSIEWERKLERLYHLGTRRLKRARKSFFKSIKTIKSEWDARFYRLLERHRRRVSGKDSLWAMKLNALLSGWNLWWYKIEGCLPTITKDRKTYSSWYERYRYILSFWRRKRKTTEFDKRLNRIQRLWRGISKRIRGGKTMDKDLRNERMLIQDLRGMLAKQNYRCALSGRLLTPDNCSLDHIVPLLKGGTHTPDNAQLVCSEINKAKANLTDEEFISVCKDVVEFNRNKTGS